MILDREKKIQDLLAEHPYLIDARFHGCRGSVEDSVSGKKRTDIRIVKRKRLTVVEVKRTCLKAEDLWQLSGYCDALALQKDGEPPLASVHYLVGKAPSSKKKQAELEKALKEVPYNVTLLYLIRDIATDYIYDYEELCYVPYIADVGMTPPRYNDRFRVKI